MKLAYAILADAAEVTSDKKLTIMGGEIDTISVATLPAVHNRLALAINVELEPSDQGADHRFHIDLYDPHGNRLLRGDALPFLPSQTPPEAPEHPRRYLFVLNLPPLVFLTPGKYTFRLMVDDEQLAEIPLHVRLVSPSP